MSKRFDDGLFLLNSAADPRTVVLDGMHRDLLTGTDTTGAVDLGPEGAVALIERTS
jgi:beta-galactosidase